MRYLESFFKRTQPLQILSKVYKELESFDEEFEEGRCPGWEDRGEGKQVTEAEGAIDLDAFDTVEELMTIGEAIDTYSSFVQLQWGPGKCHGV